MEPDCSWMYNRNNPGRAGMIPEFAEGVTSFINHAKTLDDFLTSRLIRCPCVNCENVRYHTTENVAMHLMMKGFKPGYTVWTSHDEVESDTMFSNFVVGESSRSTEHNYVQDRPPTQEETDNLYRQSVGEPIRGSIYGLTEKAYQKKSWYCGSSSSSFNGVDRETMSAIEGKISCLNAELAVVANREKKREERERKREEEIAAAKKVASKRYATLQAQLTILFYSRKIVPPCPTNSDGYDQEGDENDKSDKES